ncbi:hypothetical protein PGTUg99_030587 [Puccinia graminis f. sp. tritici]|uniref:Uncharacterized protein n=1 Tax=Puccinia graminis f. sp. tritici TaxID=56615 RepID=A0A5B0NKS7_PUCGR|nr:hypothetical protein PGTUg99_030587 [Puccinia graminis f. sp. tritici]
MARDAINLWSATIIGQVCLSLRGFRTDFSELLRQFMPAGATALATSLATARAGTAVTEPITSPTPDLQRVAPRVVFIYDRRRQTVKLGKAPPPVSVGSEILERYKSYS